MTPASFKEKLAGYLAATAAVSAISADSEAQNIIYTDPNPDPVANTANGNYNLDVNNDNINDFIVNVYSSFGNDVEITPLASNQVLCDISPLTGNGYHFGYPSPLNLNDGISPTGTHWFGSGNQNVAGNPVYDGYGGGWPIVEGGYSIGQWATDKYIGLKFQVGGQTHYGWVRVQGSQVGIFNTAVTIKSYAYESTPNTQILAGDTTSSNPIASPAANVVATDVGDNLDGSDLEVSFDKAPNESSVSEYRIMVVKNANAAAFDTIAANAVPMANYTTAATTGLNQTVLLPATANDVNGDPIQNLEPYRVFVLSVANGTTSTVNALSSASNLIELSTVTPAVNAPMVADVGDNANGSDLEVSFNAASTENVLQEYRIFVVKSSAASGFTLPVANAVPAANYTVVSLTGSNQTVVLNPTTTDTDGALLVNNEPYQVFVMSVADGVNATTNALSVTSAAITLTSPPSLPTNIMATDELNTGNASDIRITFDRSPDENRVSEYRLMFVTAPAASSFTLTDATNVPAGRYLSISPSGSNIDQFLPASMTDVNGNVLPPNTTYRAFLLTVPDGSIVTDNGLAGPSADVTLIQTAGAATSVQASDVGNANNGNDLRFGFDAALNETFIGEYRAIAVKTAQAASFTLADAQSVNAANYTVVTKNGSPNYLGLFGATGTDSDGDLIANGIPYQVFIWSVADQVIATNDSLSMPSASVTLSDLTSTSERSISAGFIYRSNGIISVKPDAVAGNFQIIDMRGVIVQEGLYQPNDEIRVAKMPSGIYFFRTSTRAVIRFHLP